MFGTRFLEGALTHRARHNLEKQNAANRVSRLSPHVVPELEALLLNGSISGSLIHDMFTPASPETKRIIAMGLFSSHFNPLEVPVYCRVQIGSEIEYRQMADSQITPEKRWDALLTLREAALSLYIGLASDQIQQKRTSQAWEDERLEDFIPQDKYENIPFSLEYMTQLKKLFRPNLRDLYFNAEKWLTQALAQQRISENHPFFIMLSNLSKIIQFGEEHKLFVAYETSKMIRKTTAISPSEDAAIFSNRGVNTLGSTAYKVAKLILQFGAQKGITDADLLADIFANSEEIGQILANDGIESFSYLSRLFTDESHSQEDNDAYIRDFRADLFALVEFTDKQTGERKMKLTFSKKGFRQIAEIRKRFQEDRRLPDVSLHRYKQTPFEIVRRSITRKTDMIAKYEDPLFIERCPARQNRRTGKNGISVGWAELAMAMKALNRKYKEKDKKFTEGS